MSKSKFDKVSYNNKFNAKAYDRLNIVVPKGTKPRLQDYCKSKNISINKLINNYISMILSDNIDEQQTLQ